MKRMNRINVYIKNLLAYLQNYRRSHEFYDKLDIFEYKV
jgi:hypothetical protein